VLLAPESPDDDTTTTVPDDEDDGDDGQGDGDDAPAPPPTLIPVETVIDPVGDPLSYVEQIVHDHAVSTGLTTAIGFRRETRGLVVTIVTDMVLFAPGEANIEPDGFEILGVVADALMDVPNHVTIEGHTDSRPISTSQYPSNWELSTSRATSVLRYLVESRGFPGERASAAGYADTHPVDAGTSAAAFARNRRVEIVVLATA
jgi:chemotaxis protein MotB